jgi:type VI secretion system protein ImpK
VAARVAGGAMSRLIERRTLPSIFSARGNTRADDAGRNSVLPDLMQEGFYVLFLLQSGALPATQSPLMDRVIRFLDEFERKAKLQRIDGDDIEAAKYAFCASFDEIILHSGMLYQDGWRRSPLQLELFNDHLAGEQFFGRLAALRNKGPARLAALQVFHLCLLLGFNGRFAEENGEKLPSMVARLGNEIAHIKGKSRGFAPRAGRPDQVAHRRRSALPLWALSTLLTLTALSAYLGLRTSLAHATSDSMAPYAELVKLAPRAAHLTITLP